MNLTVNKRDDGKLNIKGLAIWSTGTFHGYGSPPEGDTFTEDDLAKMAEAHQELGRKIRPKIYPGHKLNPLLKLLARPKGEITNLYVEDGFLKADIEGVDPSFWDKAMEDGARFSPDVKFGYTDPKTGKRYDKVIVGLGVLGAAHPANPELPPLDDYVANYYAAAYGDDEVRSYMTAPAEVPVHKRDDLDAPSDVYLDPKNKKYPVKRKKDGKWVYSKKDLQDAIRLANMHGKTEIAKKAKGIMEREFGDEMGDKTNPKNDGDKEKSYAADESKEDVMADPKERDEVKVEAIGVNPEDLAEIQEQLQSYAARLEEAEKARVEAERKAAEAEELARKTAQVLEAQLIEQEVAKISAFVDGLVEEMRIPPAASEGVKTLLLAAAGVGEKVSSYALGDVGEAGEKSMLELAKEVFSAFPKPEKVEKDYKAAEEMAAYAGVDTRAYARDPEAAAVVRQKVEAYMAEHPGVKYAEAMLEVIKGGN